MTSEPTRFMIALAALSGAAGVGALVYWGYYTFTVILPMACKGVLN